MPPAQHAYSRAPDLSLQMVGSPPPLRAAGCGGGAGAGVGGGGGRSGSARGAQCSPRGVEVGWARRRNPPGRWSGRLADGAGWLRDAGTVELGACAWRTGLATEVGRIRTATRPYRPDSIKADPPPVGWSRSSERAVVGDVPARCLTGLSPLGRPECDGRDRPVQSSDVPRKRALNTLQNRGHNSMVSLKITVIQHIIQDTWRMGWDSNPRGTCAPAGFQDRCLRPLGHPSAARYHQSACLRSSRKRHRSASWLIGALLCYRAPEAAPAPERNTILELAGGARAWRNW